jgi:predicted lipoprotein with Yx(FWY)xxD motif
MTRARGLALAGAAVAAALAAGCGGEAADRPPSASTAATASPTVPAAPNANAARDAEAAPARVARRGTTVRIVRSQFGRILADGRGQALYLFTRETSRTSRCYGDCATAWPPVPARGRPAGGRGARASLIGTTRRRDGTLQVTYAGRPVYYYVGDSPGRVLCHNVTEFGGIWRVIRADGSAVR